MRGRGLRGGGMTAGLQHDHRLDARHAPRRRHELARVGDALDVHQDGTRVGVARQHVEHVAEVDVAHVAHRDKVREADALGGAPVGEPGQHRAGLRHRRNTADLEIARPEARVQAKLRHRVADGVGPDDAQQMRPGGAQDLLPPAGVHLGPVDTVARARADDHGNPRAALAQFHDQSRDRFRRRHHDREVGHFRQFRECAVDAMVGDLAALHVDEVDLSVKSASQQVACHRSPHRARPHAGADRHDRLRRHKLVEVTGRHRLTLSTTIVVQP